MWTTEKALTKSGVSIFCKGKEALDDCCDVQRRGGRSSGDVQVLRLDDDGQGSRTEYMKVMDSDSYLWVYDTKLRGSFPQYNFLFSAGLALYWVAQSL